MFAQGGKTEVLLDVMGERLDASPVPILWVGPTQRFVEDQMEPRITDLLEQAPNLSRKLARGKKNKKTKKSISGVTLRLAHGGSSVALKSDPFGLAITDEADEMMANLNGAGNPIRLIDRRGDTYADFVHAITSTPSRGPSEVDVDPDTGLEFWAMADPDEIESTIWRLWQSGTRHHWAWPCPYCQRYFIPRLRQLVWDKPLDENGKELPSTPDLARRTARVCCPRCDARIEDEHKDFMNDNGVFVCPGQDVLPNGEVVGPEPDSITVSYWVSGLASPFKSFGDRAAEYVEAVRLSDPNELQTVVNGSFGELFVPGGGTLPSWSEVKEHASEAYRYGELPAGVKIITMTVDVQKTGLYYVIRGWGAFGTSWLLENDFLFGETSEEEVWEQLAVLMEKDFNGIPIRMTMIDAGYRPGKKTDVPVHRVYEFCFYHPKAVPARGSSTQMTGDPIKTTKLGAHIKSANIKTDIDVLRLDTDFFKTWVHDRIRLDTSKQGAWHLPFDVTDDYCQQMVSEARLKKPGGKVTWVKRAADNHYWDCESMQAALYKKLNLRLLRDNRQPDRATEPQAKPTENNAPKGKSRWLRDGSIWD